MADRPPFAQLLRILWPVAAGAVVLLAFFSVGHVFLESYALDLGAWGVPAVRHTYFLFFWTLLGSAAALLLAAGLARLPASARHRLAGMARPRDAVFVAGAMAAALIIAGSVRAFVLRGAALTDDESAYRFMGETVATGRLWVASHPMKAFFDRIFMINDGKFYAQYFIGWPALMAPGAWIGLSGYMNALYSALTVPAVFLTARRMAGAAAGRAATLLYLASPMLAVGAATELSHTTCLMALGWATYCLLRSWDEGADWRWHAGVSAGFGLAFLIRPLAAVGIGLPVLVGWLAVTVRRAGPGRRRALAAFAVPAAALAAVFFGVNLAQNGSPLVTAYQRMQAYMREVGYLNVGWSAADPPTSLGRYVFGDGGWEVSLARTTVGLVRLIYDLFGSPLLVGLVALGWGNRRARIAWWSAAFFVAAHGRLADSGVDTFGPVHFYELAWPLLVLGGVGYARLASLVRGRRPGPRGAWASALVAALVIVSLAGFAPVRLRAVAAVASNVNAPASALRARGISHAVVFTAGLFVDQRCIAPTRHFVYFRPNNDPALHNDILWVNHLGWTEDQRLMTYFPGRTPYLMTWRDCRPIFQEIK